jgi:hypothetical protein
MRTWDYNDVRRHSACVFRGHEFLRKSEDFPNGAARYECKCGALAEVTGLRIKVHHGRPQTLEEKQAVRDERKRKHERG